MRIIYRDGFPNKYYGLQFKLRKLIHGCTDIVLQKKTQLGNCKIHKKLIANSIFQ